MMSRLLKIKGLFCRISSLLLGSFAQETNNFEEPTNRSHPICMLDVGVRYMCLRCLCHICVWAIYVSQVSVTDMCVCYICVWGVCVRYVCSLYMCSTYELDVGVRYMCLIDMHVRCVCGLDLCVSDVCVRYVCVSSNCVCVWCLCGTYGAGRRGMRWLRLVGSLKLQVSFAKEPYKRDYILQKRHMILGILLVKATP